MDALTMTVVAALAGAIILFEINKRERTKGTRFFNGYKMASLVAADRKAETILNAIDHLPQHDFRTREYLSGKLSQLTVNFENSDITLSEYHAGLDELLDNHLAVPSLHLFTEGYI